MIPTGNCSIFTAPVVHWEANTNVTLLDSIAAPSALCPRGRGTLDPEDMSDPAGPSPPHTILIQLKLRQWLRLDFGNFHGRHLASAQ
jgi:hypothetical protein